jgi:SPP1 family predicted phage head-tail adaptor
MMEAGALRNRVSIEAPPTDQDTSGAPTGPWSLVTMLWAAIEPLQGREYYEASQHPSAVDHRIRVRYTAGIAPAMRVRLGERLFDIEAVIDVGERREQLHLMAKERR